MAACRALPRRLLQIGEAAIREANRLILAAVAIRACRLSMLGGWPEAASVRTGFAASNLVGLSMLGGWPEAASVRTGFAASNLVGLSMLGGWPEAASVGLSMLSGAGGRARSEWTTLV